MLNTSTLTALLSILPIDEVAKIIAMQTILQTVKSPLNSDGAFSKKCINKFATLLGESMDSAIVALNRLIACHEYEQRCEMPGAPGSLHKSLADCLAPTLPLTLAQAV